MARFDQAIVGRFKSTEGESVSNRLRPLLEAVYQQVLADPINLAIRSTGPILLLQTLFDEEAGSYLIQILSLG